MNNVTENTNLIDDRVRLLKNVTVLSVSHNIQSASFFQFILLACHAANSSPDTAYNGQASHSAPPLR